MSTLSLLIAGASGAAFSSIIFSLNNANNEYTKKKKNIEYDEIKPYEYNYIDFDRIDERVRGEFILFDKVLNEKVDINDLNNYYNNINDVKVRIGGLSFLNLLSGSNAVGVYKGCNNSIILDEKTYKSAIFHELEHLSSTYTNGKIIHSGFSQTNLSFNKNLSSFGNGLNEGYTEYITQKDFKDLNLDTAYINLQSIIEKWELVIGEKELRSFYYNANLYGLVNELKKYSNTEEINRFINNLDYICNNNYKTNVAREFLKVPFLAQKNKEVYEYIYKIFLIKNYYELESKIISESEYLNRYNKITGPAYNIFHFNNSFYIYITDDERNKKEEEVNSYIKENDYSLRKKIYS